MDEASTVHLHSPKVANDSIVHESIMILPSSLWEESYRRSFVAPGQSATPPTSLTEVPT